ncbi:MAG TPA: methyltransferase domain-containing protein [Candidatus Limnocylindria bacterium]|nr:methyltransferase domain-containing protein [Candidatus Limnocylindria bacterium]
MRSDAWDPARYEQFRDERLAPGLDLLALVEPMPGARVVDLGCGTGELTRLVHERLGARETLGIDTSANMLAAAAAHAGGGLRFEQRDAAAFDDRDAWDVVFSNALIQWLPDHPRLLARLLAAVVPGGQLALQFPANFTHPSHVVAVEVAAEPPFRDALGGWSRDVPVLAPEAYAELLHHLGCERHHVRLQVYGHRVPSREAVIDWVRGTLLTDYERRLEPAMYERFLARYRERLLPRLAPTEPFFFAFKRILLWARRAPAA